MTLPWAEGTGDTDLPSGVACFADGSWCRRLFAREASGTVASEIVSRASAESTCGLPGALFVVETG